MQAFDYDKTIAKFPLFRTRDQFLEAYIEDGMRFFYATNANLFDVYLDSLFDSTITSLVSNDVAHYPQAIHRNTKNIFEQLEYCWFSLYCLTF